MHYSAIKWRNIRVSTSILFNMYLGNTVYYTVFPRYMLNSPATINMRTFVAKCCKSTFLVFLWSIFGRYRIIFSCGRYLLKPQWLSWTSIMPNHILLPLIHTQRPLQLQGLPQVQLKSSLFPKPLQVQCTVPKWNGDFKTRKGGPEGDPILRKKEDHDDLKGRPKIWFFLFQKILNKSN